MTSSGLPLSDEAGFAPGATACYYCGMPAETTDHVIPQSLIHAVKRSGDEMLLLAVEDPRRRMTVPACRECNGLAGYKYHETLADRAQYVRERLAHKHRKALATPDWEPRELFQLSATLRRRVIAALYERDLTRRRLRDRHDGLTVPDLGTTWWAGDDA
jgi:hypothetical protein